MKYSIDNGKPNAPTGVIATMPVLIFVMICLFALAFYQGVVQKVFDVWFWISIIGGASIYLYGGICDKIFNYCEDAWIEFSDKSIVYGYRLNNKILATSDTSVKLTIKSIGKYKIKGDSIRVWGTVIKKAPLRKVTEINECKIILDHDNRGKIIEGIKSFAGKGSK